MSSFRENLKLYLPFQNKSVTGIYLLQLFPFTFLFIDPNISTQMTEAAQLAKYSYTPIFPFIFSMFFFGRLVSSIQYEILLKPVSFILPDHDKIRLKIIMLFGAGASLLFLIIFILLPEQPVNFKYFIYVLLFTITGLPFYFIGVYLSFISYKIYRIPILFFSFFLIFICSMLLLMAGITFMQDYKYSFVQFILQLFLPLFFSFILIFSVVLRLLKDSDLKRKHSSSYHRSFFQTSEGHVIGLFGKVEITDDKDWESLPGQYLMRQMCSNPYLGIKKTLMGVLYHVVEFMYYSNGQSKGNKGLLLTLIILTLIQLLTGYKVDLFSLHTHAMFSSAPVFMLCILFSIYFKPYDNNILLPIGRSNQFKSNYLAWLSKFVFITGWIIFTVLLSCILNIFMPDLSFLGYELNYNTLGFFPIFLPLVIIPAYDIFMDIIKFKASIISLFLSGGIIGGIGAYLILPFNNKTQIIDTEIPLIWISLIIIIISNSAYFFMLKRHWFRSDIV